MRGRPVTPEEAERAIHVPDELADEPEGFLFGLYAATQILKDIDRNAKAGKEVFDLETCLKALELTWQDIAEVLDELHHPRETIKTPTRLKRY